eukprot:GHVQ01005066.1.p1 GENE.GHVQ01005066.1~~GHVQ01005066.1.p1  ORF type:complete len:126 (+),score=6.21 GHVQ01005066.1:157-534(+)
MLQKDRDWMATVFAGELLWMFVFCFLCFSNCMSVVKSQSNRVACDQLAANTPVMGYCQNNSMCYLETLTGQTVDFQIICECRSDDEHNYTGPDCSIPIAQSSPSKSILPYISRCSWIMHRPSGAS